MTNALVKRLDPTTIGQKKTLKGLLGKVKTVSGFLSDALTAFKGSSVADSIREAAPWVGMAADAVPPVKFVASLLDELTKEHEPETLAYLACTLAYQRSIEQAVGELPDQTSEALQASVERWMDEHHDAKDEAPKIKGMTLGGLSQLPFLEQAETLLVGFAKVVNYSEEQANALAYEARVRFPTNFNLLLSHGKTRDKFAPLTQYLELGGGEDELVHAALLAHAEYQRRLFEEERVLGGEPFALANVYVDVECGALTWGQLRGMDHPETGKPCKPDPFSEVFGGRHPLLATVMGLLEDSQFHDAIVIQGVAGSGKSTFTLRLCTELVRCGFRPIRVRLRDVTFDRHPRDSLARAVKLVGEDADQSSLRLPEPEHMFHEGKIFKEQARFGETKICPYVLILDGWDEISVSADAGFRKRVTDFLEKVRAEYLDRTPRVRIVVTGRPTGDVTHEGSGFFHDRTQVLTIRPLAPASLKTLVDNISLAAEQAPLGWAEGETPWSPPPPVLRDKLVELYKKGVEEAAEYGEQQRARSSESLPIVGLPLIAHMTVRLLASKIEGVETILNTPTTLYRRLADLTCSTAAARPEAALQQGNRPRIEGPELRALLHLTATAMTIEGEDSISHQHLKARIGRLGKQKLGEHSIVDAAGAAAKELPISKLMVSYFFKGGRTELGCEFAHKSFREYLFAEALVEVLKDYGRRPEKAGGARTAWWSDFGSRDARYWLSRALGPRLSAQWLTAEVAAHIDELISWEVNRARQSSDSEDRRATKVSTWDEWCKIRDGLASLWEWWAEGVHLRPQVKEDVGRPAWIHESLYAEELIKFVYPITLNESAEVPGPVRIVTIDAHLGDGLFRLCASVHRAMLDMEPWRSDRAEYTTDHQWWNKYQALWNGPSGGVMMFRPGGPSPGLFFANFKNRINGAGWRPEGDFPEGLDLSLVDLVGADLVGADLVGADLVGADLSGADLSSANLIGADLSGANLSGAYLSGANLSGANLSGAGLVDVELVDAGLSGVDLSGVDLSGVDLSKADLSKADLSGADLNSADLSGVDLRGADLRGADLRVADLSGADLSGTDLREADLRSAGLREADLREADLRSADLREADLHGARLRFAASVDGLDYENAVLDEDDRQFLLKKAPASHRSPGAAIVEISTAAEPSLRPADAEPTE